MRIYKYIICSSYRAKILIDVAFWFKKKRNRRLATLVLAYCKRSTGVEVSYNASIGQNLKIAHGQNIVIGGESILGNNITIYNGVTLGIGGELEIVKDKVIQKSFYPTIEDNCIIYTGAKVLGKIIIGKNSIIGANSVVLKSMPSNSVIGGIPAKVLKINYFNLEKF